MILSPSLVRLTLVPAISSIVPVLCDPFVKPTLVAAPASIVTAPFDSDNVILVPPIKFNVSVAPIAEPSA